MSYRLIMRGHTRRRILNCTQLAILTLLACAGAFYSHSASAQDISGKRVALLTNATTSTWVAGYNNAIIDRFGKLGVRVINLTTPQDAALQAQQVDDSIAQKFDLIIVNAVNEIAIVPALERAKKAGTPVILSVQPIAPQHSDLYVSLVGHDMDDSGANAARQLISAVGSKGGNIAVIQGNPAQAQTTIILDGFKRELAKHPAFKLVAVEGKSWRPDEASAIARQLNLRFAAQGGLQGIFAMNDAQANQVVMALDSAGKKAGQDVTVVSAACTREGVDLIEAGKLTTSYDIGPVPEGEFMVEYAARFLRGEKIPKTAYMPSEGLTKANISARRSRCTY